MFVGTLGLTWWVYRLVPQAFIPEEDPGYFIIQVQGPAGASLEYTGEIAKRAEGIILKDPDVMALFSVMGFSFSGAASNQGLMFIRLKPFDDRIGAEHSVQAVLGRISGPLFGIPGAIVVGFTPPAIQGLSRFGGFEFQVLDQSGGEITRLSRRPHRRLPLPATGRPSCDRGCSARSRPTIRSCRSRSIGERALALGLPLSEITSALQIFLGSQYVNDFEFNNRAYRVYVQADQKFRSNPQALRQLYARTRTGDMVPLEQVVRMEETTAPQVINHFNLFRSASINGSAAQGVSSGEALTAMEQLADANLPAGDGLRLVGHLARGNQGRTAVVPHLRARAAARLPDAGRAVRKPRAAVHRAARRAGRGPRSAGRSVVARLRERRLLPGRSRHARSGWRRRTRSSSSSSPSSCGIGG